MNKWLEISIEVDGELAEAVAEVLQRYMPEGVAIESTSIIASADDVEGKPAGLLRVYGYLPVDHELETKRQQLEQALWYLGRIRPLDIRLDNSGESHSEMGEEHETRLET